MTTKIMRTLKYWLAGAVISVMAGGTPALAQTKIPVCSVAGYNVSVTCQLTIGWPVIANLCPASPSYAVVCVFSERQAEVERDCVANGGQPTAVALGNVVCTWLVGQCSCT